MPCRGCNRKMLQHYKGEHVRYCLCGFCNYCHYKHRCPIKVNGNYHLYKRCDEVDDAPNNYSEWEIYYSHLWNGVCNFPNGRQRRHKWYKLYSDKIPQKGVICKIGPDIYVKCQ